MRVNDALGNYVVQLRADGRSDHTIAQVQRHVRSLANWIGAIDIDELRHEHVARFLASDAVTKRADGAPRKPASCNAVRSSLRTFFGFAHAAGYSRSNAGRLIRRAACPPPHPRALASADCTRLLLVLERATTPSERRDRALFATMLAVGLRVGSAVHLDVQDLDLDAAELRLRRMKNGDEDTVFLPPKIMPLLRGYLAGRMTGPLFPAAHGGRMSARSVHRRLELWAERAGVAGRVHPHRLRHTFGTRLFRATSDVLLVARALCHKSVASTTMYVQMDVAAVKAAVEAGWRTNVD